MSAGTLVFLLGLATLLTLLLWFVVPDLWTSFQLKKDLRRLGVKIDKDDCRNFCRTFDLPDLVSEREISWDELSKLHSELDDDESMKKLLSEVDDDDLKKKLLSAYKVQERSN